MVQIFAHRGSSGTHPENTFSAFREAVKMSTDGIEIDVHLTKDNELVVIHDNTVNRTTNGKGYVKDFTLQEIKQLDAGSWFAEEFTGERIPTLEEVLIFLEKEKQILNIELKNVVLDYHGLEDKVVEMVRKYHLTDRVIISSFNHISLHEIGKSYPDIKCGVLTLDKQYQPWNYITSVGATSIHPHWLKCDQEMITEMQLRNIPVRVYVINKKDQMRRFINYNVTALMTDYPELALQIRDELTNN
ncbi:glycerophosphodiester phosphodiesterase [Gracilibacillus timonensis]|uniref:glycerophosphodiester phosphodiesterase n=1 Tax=Gracilibacillus timonensis TaxID=1816696 RepID=UPI000825A2F5|nr:glycerophosphodiester phosphodiesterase [Gracilibacillus timonensis]